MIMYFYSRDELGPPSLSGYETDKKHLENSNVHSSNCDSYPAGFCSEGLTSKSTIHDIY